MGFDKFPLVSNDGVALAVRDAFASGRLPHAIIIEGEQGTGRHTLAKYIAAGAVCPNESVPCGECKSCHIAEVGSHPDIMVVSAEDGKKSISVDTVRKLRTEAYLKPNISERRVFIIDPADAMSDISQNALLKVLEEPPKSAMFILIVSRISALLATVRSRCVTFTLSSVPKEQAIEYILERFDYERSAIEDAVNAAGGNIGRALSSLVGDTKLFKDAKELLNLALKKDKYGMLCVFKQYEKDRVQATELLNSFKMQICEKMSEQILCESQENAAFLSRLFDLVCDAEKRMALNINLSLLFTGFCSTIR